MKTKRVYLTSAQDVVDLMSIGVSVWCSTPSGSIVVNVTERWSKLDVLKWFSHDALHGHQYFIEVEDDED